MAIDGRPIRVEDAKLLAAIERLRRALPLGGDMTPAFRSIGRIGKTESQLRFREQQAPDGTRWKPSKRVIEEGGQTLRLTARLQRSITFQADHASAEIGTNVIYARIHQIGGVAGRTTFKGEGPPHRSRIDARPFLGLSEAGIQAAVEAVNDHLSRRWEGR